MNASLNSKISLLRQILQSINTEVNRQMLDEKDKAEIAAMVKSAVTESVDALVEKKFESADLNKDGKVTKNEQFIYDLFKAVTSNLQKGSIITALIMAVFFIVSVFV